MTNAQEIQILKEEIRLINERFEDSKSNYQTLYDGANNINSRLSNQISYTNLWISILVIVITIGGVILGLWIADLYKRIKRAKKIVKETKEYIDGHNTDLYKKLKREDVLDKLKRLEEVPDDITNVLQLLLSVDLLPEDFFILKRAYLSIIDDDMGQASQYMTLFFQHHSYEVLKDPDIGKKARDSIVVAYINAMFLRDIKIFFEGMVKFLKEEGINKEDSKEIIKRLFGQLFFSRHKKQIVYLREFSLKNGLDYSGMKLIAKEANPASPEYISWLES
jgi:hypothetical protein